MRLPRYVLVPAILIVPAMLAGCNAEDWWNDQGILIVNLASATESTSSISRLATAKIGILSLTVKPMGEIRSTNTVKFNPPLGIDLAQRAAEGKGMKIFEKKLLRKPIEAVTVQVFIVDTQDLQGNRIPACPVDKKSEVHPCIAIPKGGNYVFDRTHDPVNLKRGGTTTLEFPLAVVYDKRSDEYYIQSQTSMGKVNAV